MIFMAHLVWSMCSLSAVSGGLGARLQAAGGWHCTCPCSTSELPFSIKFFNAQQLVCQMNSAILTPIITALAALLGVALSNFLQAKTQNRSQRFQKDAEATKYQREQRDRQQSETAQRLVTVHKLLSKTAREFSITNLDIMWRSGMSDGEYDARYLVACTEFDELRALIGLYQPHLSENVEAIDGQMNIFWGSFKDVLYQTAKGKQVDHRHPSLLKAHVAAEKIAQKVDAVKGRLIDNMKENRAVADIR
jgi:hypothetical protein